MTCLDDLDVLDYIEHRLPEPRSVDIRHHLDGCAECVLLVAQLAGEHQRPALEGLRLGRTISSGGMGVIVEAFDTQLERRVAVKLPRTDDPLVQRRFQREVKITARLQHPAIVPVYAAGTLGDGEPYYAMRLVDGESLDAAIAKTTTLTERLALVRVVTTVAGAIAYAHSQGILHRDIKPANVLVGNFGEVVVIDWGLARSLDETEDVLATGSPGPLEGGYTVDGAVVGTPAYMAPEQARGESVDARADVYALGALLYHVLRGEPPGSGDLATKVPELPRDLVAIVDEAMATDAAQRYPTAAELVGDLERFQTGQLVGAHAYSLGQLLRRWARKHRTALTAGVLALTTVLVIGGVAISRIIRAERVAAAQRERAVAHRGDVEDLLSFMLTDLRDKLLPIGKLDILDAVAKKAMLYYATRTTDLEPTDLENRAGALENVGEVLVSTGDLGQALAMYRTALDLRQGFAVIYAGNEDAQINLSVAWTRVGEALAKQGDEEGALVAYRSAFAIDERLALAAPADMDRQRSLSVTLTWIGGVYMNQAKLPEALAAFRRALAIDERAAASDPNNARWQRGLSIAQSRVADALLAQGDAAGALVLYRASMTIDERAAAKDPTDMMAQHDVLRDQLQVAEVLRALGDPDSALALYGSSQALGERLVASDPSNRAWQRDVETSAERVGEVLVARGDLQGAMAAFRTSYVIARELADIDPTNPTWQRDLSVAYDKLGSVLGAQGKTGAAIVELRKGFAIAERMAAAEPDDPALQRDLVVSHTTIGDTFATGNDLPHAISEYRAALALGETLLGKHATAESDVVEVRTQLGGLLAKHGETAEARAQFRAALALLDTMIAADPANTELATTRPALAARAR